MNDFLGYKISTSYDVDQIELLTAFHDGRGKAHEPRAKWCA